MTELHSMCDIVIPVYGQPEYTRVCVESILAHTAIPFHLLLVDDASQDLETKEYLKALQIQEPERVTILWCEINQGYVKAVNLGLQKTSADFVVVMNNDTIVYPGWLPEMIAIAEKDPQIGIVSPQWDPPKRFRGDREQYFQRFVLPRKGAYIETDWSRGFCYLTKRCVIDKIGGLDADFAPAYFDDWDYSMRAITAGYRCVVALGAFVFHFKNVTYGACGEMSQINTLLNEKASVFYKRWGKPLKILIVEPDLDADEQKMVGELLRDQNRVFLVTSHDVDIQHTNLTVVKVAPWLLGITVARVLLDDVRHSVSKRFHLVIGDRQKFFLPRSYQSKNFQMEQFSLIKTVIKEKKFEQTGK